MKFSKQDLEGKIAVYNPNESWYLRNIRIEENYVDMYRVGRETEINRNYNISTLEANFNKSFTFINSNAYEIF